MKTEDNANKITLTLHAATPEALEALVAGLASRFGGYPELAENVTLTATTTQPLTGESTAQAELAPTPGRKPGRPKKVTPEEDPGTAPAEQHPPAEPENTDGVSANTVSELSPEDMRKKGIEHLMAWFGQHPDGTPTLTKLQQRYGVKMFKDVPDDKAAEFLADVHLLVNGTAQTE